MLPVTGPWVDTHDFTDIALLEGIAGLSPLAAVGVLTNRNLTGAALQRVADNAALTYEHVHQADTAALLSGRSDEDQLVILRAAYKRSKAAARDLLRAASTEVLHRVLTGEAGFPAAFREEATSTVTDLLGAVTWWRPRLTDARFTDIVQLCVRDLDYAASLVAQVHIGDPEALIAMTETYFVPAEDGRRSRRVDVDSRLLVATVGHPEVVRHWGEHGGTLGARVACGDPRQDPDWLRALGNRHGELGFVEQYLRTNPAIPYEERVAPLVAEIVDLLKQPRGDARGVELAARQARDLCQTAASDRLVTDPDNWRSEDAVPPIVHGRTWAVLAQLELLFSGRLRPDEALRVAQDLAGDHLVPLTLVPRLRDALGTRQVEREERPAGHRDPRAALADLLGVERPVAAPRGTLAERSLQQLAGLGATAMGSDSVRRFPLAAELAETFTRPEQYERLYGLAHDALSGGRRDLARTKLDEVARQVVAAVPHQVNGPDHAPLIPDALGTL